MKKLAICLILVFATVSAVLVALAAPPPSAVGTLDVRKSTQRQFDLNVAQATDARIRFYLVENGVAWTNARNASYTGTLAWAATYTSTPVRVAASAFGSGTNNSVDFDATAAKTATAGSFVAQVTLVETSTARRVQWGRGAITIEQGF